MSLGQGTRDIPTANTSLRVSAGYWSYISSIVFPALPAFLIPFPNNVFEARKVTALTDYF